MSTYAIGDVQGCWRSLERLLERIAPGADDRLWMVGDLVNRGGGDLDCLRWARAQGECLVLVLGNHDLHLIARWLGVARRKRRDTVDAVLEAPDADELVEWLRHRPLLYREDPHVLVHAGLLPEWSIADAERWARRLEAWLRGEDAARLLEGRTRERRPRYREADPELARAQVALSALTNLRTLTADGRLDLDFTGPPHAAPEGHIPWFDHPGRRSGSSRVVCGHWASLGLLRRPDLLALDTGCVWGGALTAVRLEDGALFQVDCAEDRDAS